MALDEQDKQWMSEWMTGQLQGLEARLGDQLEAQKQWVTGKMRSADNCT